MRTLPASLLLLAAIGLQAPAWADSSDATARRTPVLRLAADGSVLAEVGVPDGGDAILILAPQSRLPSPPQRPVAATLAPATAIGLQLSPSVTLDLGAERQVAGVLARVSAPC